MLDYLGHHVWVSTYIFQCFITNTCRTPSKPWFHAFPTPLALLGFSKRSRELVLRTLEPARYGWHMAGCPEKNLDDFIKSRGVILQCTHKGLASCQPAGLFGFVFFRELLIRLSVRWWFMHFFFQRRSWLTRGVPSMSKSWPNQSLICFSVKVNIRNSLCLWLTIK